MRRTWAEAARSAVAPPPHRSEAAPPPASAAPTVAGQQNSVRAQLQAITGSLSKLHEQQQQAGAASPPPPPPAQVAAPAGGDTSQPNKTQALARVRYLEAALAALPADDPLFAEEKVTLGQRLAEAKRAVHGVRPIGARIDGARAALERSRSRQAEAAQAVEAAQQLHQLAADEVVALEAELQELRQAEREASLTSDMMCTEPGPAQAAAQPVEQAHAALNQMIASLSTDSYVHPAHLEAATAHVQQLFDGFRVTLQHAEATRAAAAGTPAPVARRAVVKGPPAAQVGRLVRHIGKQPRKELITDFFQAKKVVRAGAAPPRAGFQSAESLPVPS